MFFTKLLRFVSLLTTSLSGLVCLGWIFHIPWLVHVDPSADPMAFSTAFGLVLAGLSFAEYLLFRPQRTPYLPYALILWTLLFLFPLDAISSLFRGMSRGGSICMFFFALSLILARSQKNYKMIIAGSVSCFVGWIGLIGLMGHLADTDLELSWGAYSRMSPPTAVAVVFLGFAMPIAIYLKNKRDQHFYAFAFYVALLFTSLTMLMEQTFVRLEIQKMRQEISFKSDSVSWGIKSALMAQYEGFRRMAARMEHGTYDGRDDWAADAAGFFRDFKGLRSIHWTDANFKIRWLYPNRNDGAILGKDVKTDPVRAEFISKVRDSHQDMFSQPWDLLGGGRGFVLALPLYRNNKYAGCLGVTYRFENMFAAILDVHGYALELWDGDNLIYSYGANDPSTPPGWGIRKDMDLLNRHLSLAMTPDMATLRNQSSFVPSLVLLFGLIISTSISLAVYFYLNSRQIEKQRLEFLSWQAALMAGSPLLIISADRGMHFRSLNQTGEKMLGYTEAEVLGKFIPDFFHQEREPGYEEFLSKIRRGEMAAGEWLYHTKNGKSFYGSATVSPLKNDQGEITGFVSMIEDITEKRSQQEKMITSARLASLGEMAAGIAHEINNPLTIIGAYAATVRRELSANQEGAVKKLEAIERTVQRIAKIIRGLRSLSRETPNEEMAKISVRSLLEDTLSFCSERFRNADIELEVVADDDIFVYGQEHQLSQVLLNLLNNAYDATVNAEVKKVKICVCRKENAVEICVTDSGVGVPVELREKIMQPFFTTKEVGQGLGLGLSISRGIVASHGGQLLLDPNWEQTRFIIHLPV